MPQYAKGTSVSVSKTRAEIEDTLERYGADGFISGRDGRAVMLGFRLNNRHVKFSLMMPDPSDPALNRTPTGKQRSAGSQADAYAAEERRLWRSLFMSIKAKLVSVSDGIETFDDAFMAHIVMPDGRPMREVMLPQIANMYETGDMPPLLGVQ
jgi:hypothetical protein